MDRIDYIQGLGTTSIWLTPSFKNKAVQLEDGPSAGYHGYWVTDFPRSTRIWAPTTSFERLSTRRIRGMKVYSTSSPTTPRTSSAMRRRSYGLRASQGQGAVPYGVRPAVRRPRLRRYQHLPAARSSVLRHTPVLEPGEQNLKVPSWLNDVTLYHNRGNTTFTSEDSYYGDFFGLDDLFTEHPRVVDGMIDIYKTWIGDLGIDGFRIDTMKHATTSSGEVRP